MDDRQAERPDNRRARVAPPSGFHDDKPAIDLLPPVHPGGILLPDEAALGEADAVQLGGIAFEPEDIAELGPAFADAEAQSMFKPAGCWLIGRPKPAVAESGSRGSGRTLAGQRPVNCQPRIALNPDRPPQSIDRQPLDEIVHGLRFAVEQQVVALAPDDEVEQAFALWREQPRPDRQLAR